MRKYSIRITSILIIGIITCSTYYALAANSIGFSLEIRRGHMTIETTGSIDIGTIAGVPENRIIPIEEVFLFRDKSGLVSGHYATIQASNLSNGIDLIPKENVFAMFYDIIKLAGTENDSIFLGNSIHNQRGSIGMPSTYIYKSAGENYGYIGQYSSTGSIKIDVPANISSGTYRGKIYYLLIDKN